MSSKNIIGPLDKGTLTKYGYSTKVSEKTRHTALNKAIKATSKGTVIKKLNAVKTLTKNTLPKTSAIFGKDMKYV